MPDKGADAAGAALGGRTPRRSPGTPALCNQGNDGNCCCSQPLAAEKMGNEWSSEELGSPWPWLADIRSASDCACNMVPRHDSEDLEGIRVVERGTHRCREEAARDGKKKRSTTRGRTRAGAGEAGARRKSRAGEAKPVRGNPLAPRIASDFGSGKLASDDCGMASGGK
jgi:hypothetical protein